ncbi:hypothetical protein D3C81_1891790 [compost metagenome]
MGNLGFFHDCGIGEDGEVANLIAVAYDLAFFWKVGPEQMMVLPLDTFAESLENAQRINQVQQG